MLTNYFLLILRTLRKKSTHTAINLIGLSVGMSAFMIIMAYVSYSLSYDKFWKDYDQVYRATFQSEKEGIITDNNATNWTPLAVVAKEELPEVTASTRFFRAHNSFQKHVKWYVEEDQQVEINAENLMLADSTFFEIFSCNFIRGNEASYRKAGSCVLTESNADKIFGASWRKAEPGSDHDPIGKTIEIKSGSQKEQYIISGVIHDLPPNSHFKVEGVINHPFYSSESGTEWGLGGCLFYTYLKLVPGTNIAAFQAKLNTLGLQYEERVRNGYELFFPLQSLSDIHLHSNLKQELLPAGNHEAVYALSLVAALVLIMAWLNYINLTVVQSMERVREVGLRKVIGARRRDLFSQFILSALVLNILSSFITVLILYIGLPIFNQYLDTQLELMLYFQGVSYPALFWIVLIGVYLAGTVISGVYPSLLLSSFNPIAALKGKMASNIAMMGVNFRNGIITFQFGISILILAGALIVLKQTNHMQSQPLGFDMERVVIIENSYAKDSSFNDRMKLFQESLSRESMFVKSTISSSYPGYYYLNWHYAPEASDDFRLFTFISADYDFLDCYGIEMETGRYFSRAYAGDDRKVVINRAAVEALGYESPKEALNTMIKDDVHPDNTFEIIGVMKDYHHQSLHSEPEPIIYKHPQAQFSFYRGENVGQTYFFLYNQFISIKIAEFVSLSDAMNVLEESWRESFEDSPMNFFFLDDRYNYQYRNELLFSKVFTLFSGLAILIACLGLIGFIGYSVRQRSKEIAIRKVLGASMGQLWFLLSHTYLKLILVATLVGIPVTNYFAQDWLAGFSYRIGLEELWWIYTLPGILVIVIAILSISGQTIKVVKTNPTDSLRTE